VTPMHIAPAAARLAAVVLLVGGCITVGLGSKAETPETHRHLLDAATGVRHQPAPPPAAAGVAKPLTIAVRAFSGRSRYDLRVVRRDGPDAMTFLEFERWAEPPTDAITDAVREALAATGAFRFVSRASDGAEVDRWLDGYLLACDLVRTPSGPWKARCAVRLTLTERVGTSLASSVYESTQPLPGAGTDGLGPAMSAAVGEIVTKALADWESAALLR
jgi:ABC-type uncharacterized transport system auxiliary subunit